MTHKRKRYFLFKAAAAASAILCVSALSAKTALSDLTLENAVRMTGAFNQEALTQAAGDFEKSPADQQAEMSERINHNNQQIQESSLDGSEMSHYVTQKKRSGQNTIAVDGVKHLDMTHVVHHITDENFTIIYPDGLVVKMKSYYK